MKRTAIVVASLLTASCAASKPPIPNPNGLSNEALTVQYVIERGCLPYLLGEKSEGDAMRGVRLNHIHRLPGLVPGDGAPYWEAGLFQLLRVNVGRGVCTVVVSGDDGAAYRAAADLALLHKLGPGMDEDGCAAHKTSVPGALRGCRRHISYSYYPVPKASRYEISLWVPQR